MKVMIGVVMVAMIVLGGDGATRGVMGAEGDTNHHSLTWAQVLSPTPGHTHRQQNPEYDEDFFDNDDYEYVDTEDVNYRPPSPPPPSPSIHTNTQTAQRRTFGYIFDALMGRNTEGTRPAVREVTPTTTTSRPNLLEAVMKTIDDHIIQDLQEWSDYLGEQRESARRPTTTTTTNTRQQPTAVSTNQQEVVLLRDETGKERVVTIDDIVSSLSQLDEKTITDLLLSPEESSPSSQSSSSIVRAQLVSSPPTTSRRLPQTVTLALPKRTPTSSSSSHSSLPSSRHPNFSSTSSLLASSSNHSPSQSDPPSSSLSTGAVSSPSSPQSNTSPHFSTSSSSSSSHSSTSSSSSSPHSASSPVPIAAARSDTLDPVQRPARHTGPIRTPTATNGGETEEEVYVVEDEQGTVHMVTLDDIMKTLSQMDSSSVNSLLFGDEQGGSLNDILGSVLPDAQTQPQSQQQPSLIPQQKQHNAVVLPSTKPTGNNNNNNHHRQPIGAIPVTQNRGNLNGHRVTTTTTTTPRPRGVIVRVNGNPLGGSGVGHSNEAILGGTPLTSVTSDTAGNVHITPEPGQTINIQDIIRLAEQVSGGTGNQQVIVGGARYPNLHQQGGQAGNRQQGQQQQSSNDDKNEVSQFAHQLLRYLENGVESGGGGGSHITQTNANSLLFSTGQSSSPHRHQPQILVQPKIKVTGTPKLPPQPQQQSLSGGSLFPSLVSGLWSRLTGTEQQQEQSSRTVFPRSPQTEAEAEDDYIQVILRNQRQNSAEDEQIGLITIPLPRPIHFQTTTTTTPSPISDSATAPSSGLTGIINTLTGRGGNSDNGSSGGLTSLINTLYSVGGSRSSNPSTRSVNPSTKTSSEYAGNTNGLPPVLHHLSPAVQETLWQQANSVPKFNPKGSSSQTHSVNRRMDDGSVEFISTEVMDEEGNDGYGEDTYNFNPIPSPTNNPISSRDFTLESPNYKSYVPGLDSSSSVVKKPGVSTSSQPIEYSKPSQVINVSPQTMSVLSRVLPAASPYSPSATVHAPPRQLPQVPPSVTFHHSPVSRPAALRTSQFTPLEPIPSSVTHKRYATRTPQDSLRQATITHTPQDPLGLPASLVQRLPTNVLDNLREQYVSSHTNRLPDGTTTASSSSFKPNVAQDRGFKFGKGKGQTPEYVYYEFPHYPKAPTTHLYDSYYEPVHEYLPYDDHAYGDDGHHEHGYGSHEYSEPKHPLFDIFLLADVTKVHKIGDSNFSIKAPKIGDAKYFVDTWSQHGQHYKYPKAHHNPYHESYHHLPSYKKG
ncbi:hypothetical protein Pmani_029805 [Petrolisthes manimaculis]|uniref:Mucin-5AC n=1 Tax=Petrolisthes manimaculis TaxID=1843537 RepID=A0AAE1TUA9_9EUCA|nr:hypothetical protein Pmani_029805 [Petrolisthes manimaculis]